MKVLDYIYCLPQSYFTSCEVEIALPTVSPASDNVSESELTQSTRPTPEEEPRQEGLPDPVCHTCSTSGAVHLHSVEDQRAHFRSDWHRYNLKQKLKGSAPVDEADFADLLSNPQDEVASISGSESDTEDDSISIGKNQNRQSAHVAFRNEGGRFAIWKILLGPDAKTASPATLKERLLQLRQESAIWAVIMNRGGHFAAALFSCQQADQKPSSTAGNHAAPIFQTIAHKTFHRYVVRAKAGGKQSSKDATGKFAKSAGSQIRRYNEAALRQDIQETLKSWKGHLSTVTRIFVAAPGSNEAVLYDAESSPLTRGDPRIAKIPFITRRPTLSEAKRVMTLLMAVTEAEQTPLPQPKVAAPKAVKEKPEKQEPVEELKEAQPEPEPELHQASRRGDAELVARLLHKGHDPTVSVGKTAYAVAANKAVRDAFRRFMAEAPDRWDWPAANVPSPLTPELDQQQQAKEAEKKIKLKEKEKERKKRLAEKKKREQAGAVAAAEAEISKAAAEAAAISRRAKETPDKKVLHSQAELDKRREKMAAAAEARMAALRLASQQQQLW